MKKFNLDEFDPKKNYVIEASAGTGKTFNIVEIVDKLVNVYKENLNNILIVTYTEKATGELKDRIRKKLKGVDVDNAPIYTIHSFCQNVISEYGVSAKLPFNLEVIDESKIEKFAERYIREGEIVKNISNLMTCNYTFNFDTLKKKFVKGVQKYYLNNNYEEDELIVSLDKELDSEKSFNWIIDLNSATCIEDLFKKYQEVEFHYNVLKNSKNSKLNELANEINCNFKSNFKFNGNKFRRPKEGVASCEEIEAYEFFKSKKDTKVNINEILSHLYLKDFYIKWQKEKEINKSQTFDDMLRYVRESILHDEIFKNKLKQKYSRAIIDEFQDTNQRQFDIFSRIFLEDDDHKLIVVGDPKQSIYAFQGADINVYYNAVKIIENSGGEICVLNKNYRSTSEMVNSCNDLFKYYDFSGTDFIGSDSLSIENGDDCEHSALFNDEKMKAIWIVTNDDRSAIDEKTARLFSKIAAQQIIECCSKNENGKTKLQIKEKDKQYRNVSFKDFTILARTSNEMKYIEKSLKSAGIPYIRYKDKNLFKGRECAHWISLLEAINSIDFTGVNRNVFKKALFTSFFGYSLEEIKSDDFNKDDNFAMEIINKWKLMAHEQRWEDLFDDIIINSNIIEKLNSLKEIQSLSIYKQIGNYCIDYLSNGRSMEELIRKLKNLSSKDSGEDENQEGNLIEKSTNFDCVQIMTIHASKGLQFPVVIGVCGFTKPNSNEDVFAYHMHDEETNESKQVISFHSNDQYYKEVEAEWKRLFYVAYTRAQFLLILPFYEEYGQSFLYNSIHNLMNEHENNVKFIYDNYLSFGELRKESRKILSNNLTKKDEDYTKQEQEKILKEIIKNSYIKKSYKHSYSSLSHEEINQLDNIDYDKEGEIKENLSMFDNVSKPIYVEFDKEKFGTSLPKDYPKGAKLGTILHEVFEHIDFENYSLNLFLLIKRIFIKHGVLAKDSWVDATVQLVKNVVEAKLPIINGNEKKEDFIQLKNISLDNRKDEMEFNFNILNENLKNFCNGFVDLIFKYDVYYSIVDWKSDALNDEFESYSDAESLKLQVDTHYSIQRVLYSYCLIKWLKMYNPNLTEEEIFQRHFGGIYYVFLRGCVSETSNGIYAQTWESWKELEDSFNKIISEKVGGY